MILAAIHTGGASAVAALAHAADTTEVTVSIRPVTENYLSTACSDADRSRVPPCR
jgi:23S rRNA G2069 N7-methylase RlmK/C1962 C5-methylase RlmI